jgi:hypothetical protein
VFVFCRWSESCQPLVRVDLVIPIGLIESLQTNRNAHLDQRFGHSSLECRLSFSNPPTHVQYAAPGGMFALARECPPKRRSDDETVAKMGHPMFCCGLDLGHPPQPPRTSPGFGFMGHQPRFHWCMDYLQLS